MSAADDMERALEQCRKMERDETRNRQEMKIRADRRQKIVALADCAHKLTLIDKPSAAYVESRVLELLGGEKGAER